MSISENIFGKDLYQITQEDIVSFFSTEQEESAILEFKSGATDINKLHSEVCAFLNTDGGVLIVGSPKEVKKDNGIKICVGEPEPSIITHQDKIMHALASNITPAPTNIRTKTIPYKDGNIYIIDIPQSVNRPHQVNSEGKYYIRLEREAKAAPHGIIEALFKQRNPVELDYHIILRESDSVDDRVKTLSINVTNKSSYPARDVEGFIGILGNVSQSQYKKRPSEIIFNRRSLKSGKEYLTTSFSFPNGIIDKIWNWINFFNLRLHNDYAYVVVHMWAYDAKTTSKLYKVFAKTYEVIELDNNLGDDETSEYYQWSN